MMKQEIPSIPNKLLRTIHGILQKLNELESQLSRGPRVLKVQETTIERLQKKLDETLEKKKRLHGEAKDKQLELDTKEKHVEKRRQQLQEAKSNHEYQALKDQIAADEMANSVLADEAIELMEKCDDFDEVVKTVEKEIGEAKQQYEKLKNKFSEEEPKISGQIAKLREQLAENEAGITGDFKVIYTRNVRERGEDALAAVEGEYCRGCNQMVPVNDINGLMLEKARLCPTCGRVLYLPDGYRPK